MTCSGNRQVHEILNRKLQDAIFIAAVIKGIDDVNEYKTFWSRESSDFIGHLRNQILAKMQEIVDKEVA